MTDERLLAEAGHGREAAFLELYERHRDAVFRFAYRMLGSTELAEDVTHDCFLSLLKRPASFDPGRASLKTYLLAAARNLAMKHFRSTRGEDALEDLTHEPTAPEKRGPLRRLLDEELAAAVRLAVQSLPPLQREALVLFEYEELPLAEIAEVVGADTGTVKARLHRARQNLKRQLAPYMRGGVEEITVDEVLK
ncbi:MAG TPA: sigma-70 family RNA polymerase sigma factor [Pyrinomonadaceae bacterium]|nr:sigma-70 family RNA polymerase sigma factor [Pyrinomonadaceae bacterium]